MLKQLIGSSGPRRLALAAALGSGAVAVLVAGSVIVCPDGICRALGADAAGLAAMNAWRSAWLDAGLGAVTWLGSLFVLLPAALLLAGGQIRRRGLRAATFLPLALGSAALLSHLAKAAVERPRPDLFPALLTMPADASFPSAHAIQATAFVLAWLVRPGARSGPAGFAVFGLLAALVGVSRVHLQVHFPSDVVFGIVAAVLWVLALRCLPVWQEGKP